MSGPGADNGEERASALPTSSVASAGQFLNGRRIVSKDLAGSPAERWLGPERVKQARGRARGAGSKGERDEWGRSRGSVDKSNAMIAFMNKN